MPKDAGAYLRRRNPSTGFYAKSFFPRRVPTEDRNVTIDPNVKTVPNTPQSRFLTLETDS